MNVDFARLEKCQTFLFDIEGTICSVAFVKDVLYPYFLRELPRYIQQSWDTETLQGIVAQLPGEVAREPEAVKTHFVGLVGKDVKDTLLKQLQGHIWKDGYTSGSVSAPLYPDVIPFFAAIKRSSHQLAIYSSGSVKAQHLFFDHIDAYYFPAQLSTSAKAHSTTSLDFERDADLRENEKSVSITDAFTSSNTGEAKTEPSFFDTVNAGPKTESSSYVTIVSELGYTGDLAAENVVFFTDNPKEAEASRTAGLYTIVLLRPGNAPLPKGLENDFPVIENFGRLCASLEKS